MHGAGGGAPTGKQNGNYRHGGHTKEAIALIRRLNSFGRLLKKVSR
jgi:hypothetical protein